MKNQRESENQECKVQVLRKSIFKPNNKISKLGKHSVLAQSEALLFHYIKHKTFQTKCFQTSVMN